MKKYIKKGVSSFKKVQQKWKEMRIDKKVEYIVSYLILATLMLAVIPAIILQLQFYQFEKTVLQENLQQCQEEKVQQEIFFQKTSSSDVDRLNTFFHAAPKKEAVQDVKASQDSQAVETVRNYFHAFNRGNVYEACALLDDSKCQPENRPDLQRFNVFRDNLTNGYENLNIWESELDDGFHSDVVCVQYDYTYENDVAEKDIAELLSYYVRDGEIVARVCEKTTFNGTQDVGCPILSARDFCL